jgi:hypothetical protein
MATGVMDIGVAASGAVVTTGAVSTDVPVGSMGDRVSIAGLELEALLGVDSAEAADLAEADSTEAVASMAEAAFMVEAVSTEAAATGKFGVALHAVGSC